MLVLTKEQDIKLMARVKQLVRDFYKGKLEVNFTSWGFNNYWGKGYQKGFKRGILTHIKIEEFENNGFFNKYAITVILNDKQKQKHTFYMKLNKFTNRVELL